MNEDGSLPPHVIYKIRQNASLTDSTKFVRDRYWHPGPSPWGAFNYYQFGWTWIQDMIERAIVEVHSGKDILEPGGYVHQTPYPCYMDDQ
jgi:ATP-binding cassette subfamily A (ABC1) protein 2